MANQFSVDVERNKKIVKAYVSGRSSKQVAEEFEVSAGYVWELAHDEGVIRRGYSRVKAVVSQAIKDKVFELYSIGEGTLSISGQVDVSQATVCNILKAAGYDLRRKALTNKDKENIIALYQSGLNTYQVAIRSRFSDVTVGKVLRATGIKMRSTNALSDEEQRHVRRDYECGESAEQIAKRMCVSASAVRDSIKRQGGVMRRLWPKKEIKQGELFNPNYNPQELPDCRFSGIYRFTNLINGKIYIGQSKNIYKRYYQHREMRASGMFTRALKKYGIGNFRLEVLERVHDDILNQRETFWIEHYRSFVPNVGYNIRRM